MALIDDLINRGWLKSPRLIEAFRKIKREDFLPPEMKDLAQVNEALPIGEGQTISQPLVVAFMLEQLAPEPGDKVMDVGSGSGWTTALLSSVVGEKGKVIAVEIIPKLKEFGEKNVSRYNFIGKGIAEFIQADGSKGCPDFESRPELKEGFDGILASASGEKLPGAWKEQIKTGGRIVAPIKSSVWVFTKKSSEGKKEEFEEKEYPGFAFVPLVSEE